MKKIVGIVFCFCCLIWACTSVEHINVQYTLGDGERLWNAVAVTAAKYNDHRSVDEIIFETRKLNGIDNNRLMQLRGGNTIIIPCEIRTYKIPFVGSK